ncbi:MAG: hypothetical protein ABIR96_00080 [Bdellovibrionota bacterium]
MNAHTFKSAFFAMATLAALLSPLASAETYQQQEAALRARVDLEVERFVPELVKAKAIEELYSLVFEKHVGEYFSKNNGLVRKIIIKDLRVGDPLSEDTATLATALHEHTLNYPRDYDASDLIASRLPEEASAYAELGNLARALKKESPSLRIRYQNNVVTDTPNSNQSRLELLRNLDAVLTARSDILSALQRTRSFEIFDTVDQYGNNGFFKNSDGRSTASLVVGRSGYWGDGLYVNAISLETILDLGLIKGFDVKPAYFTQSGDFETGLMSLQNVLSDNNGELAKYLRAKGVTGFVIDPEYALNEELYSSGVLTVGTKTEEIRQVIELMFP